MTRALLLLLVCLKAAACPFESVGQELRSGADTLISSTHIAQSPTGPLELQHQLPIARNQLDLFAEQPLTEFGAAKTLASIESRRAHDYDLMASMPTPEAFLIDRPASLVDRILNDHLNFYSLDSLIVIGLGFGTGALVANTTMDASIQGHLQSSLRRANSDDWLESLHADKELGDGRFTLPLFAGAWLAGKVLPESELSRTTGLWGERTVRGFLVGAPPVLALQQLTGGSRPGELPSGSHWEPFQDNNGVSGHAFMGALPFITAAKMTNRPGLKIGFYAASTLAPLSRAADGAHYPSQVALGWGLAFVAASAVQGTDNPQARWRFLPTASPSGSGMALEYRF